MSTPDADIAWQHAGWEEQPTPAAQLAKLRQWRTELRNALTLGVSGTGHSVNSSDIRQALSDSNDDLRRLEAQITPAGYCPVRTARTRRTW
jgi:hypothetical protein